MEPILIVLFGLFVGISCFIFGKYRGKSEYQEDVKNSYQEGYNDGRFSSWMGYLPPATDVRWEKARQLIEELDELFYDYDGDDEIEEEYDEEEFHA